MNCQLKKTTRLTITFKSHQDLTTNLTISLIPDTFYCCCYFRQRPCKPERLGTCYVATSRSLIGSAFLMKVEKDKGN